MNTRTPLHRFMNQLQVRELVVECKELNDLFFEYLKVEQETMGDMFNYAMEAQAGQPVYSQLDFEQYMEEKHPDTDKLIKSTK
jgi:hypothetical protein